MLDNVALLLVTENVFPLVRLLLFILLLVLLILTRDFFLQLTELLRQQLVLHFQFCDLLLGLEQVLGEKLAVGSDSLVEILLLLEPAFSFDILFLKAGDQVVLQFDLLQTLVIVFVSFARLDTVLVTV